MRIYIKFYFLLFFSSNITYGQQVDLNNCKTRMVDERFQIISEDSLQFIVCMEKNINLENPDCRYLLLEGYNNYTPRDGINVICILTVNTSQKEKFHKIDYYSLFKNNKDQKIINSIQAGFIYDVNSEYNEVFIGKEKVKELLKKDLKKGFKKN